MNTQKKNTQKTILFISHDASRNGATIVLLHLLKWLKQHTHLAFQVLLRQGGELQEEFALLSPIFVLHRKASPQGNIMTRIFRRLGMLPEPQQVHRHKIKTQLLQQNIGMIYSNTATNFEAFELLAELNCPIISHVHELEYAIRYCLSIDHFNAVKRATDYYIAVSEAVKSNLINNHNIPEDRIQVIYEFIPAKDYDMQNCQQARQRVFQELHLPSNAQIVCASGTTDWRKGTDLFIQLALSVHHRYQQAPVYFVWVGGQGGGVSFSALELQHDSNNIGLAQFIRFVGLQTNPLDYFAACDVFVMVSREDPFPLVCLEAALQGKPIVCFDRAGGAKEFIETDAGYVVSYLDLPEMTQKVIELLSCPQDRQRLGQRAQQKVKERHDIEVSAPKILRIIEECLHESTPSTRTLQSKQMTSC